MRLHPKPEIFNTDQGSQFTSKDFTDVLKDQDIKISMDGKGRCMDNIFIERLWRSVKYEEIYLNDYATTEELRSALRKYFHFYNTERPHQTFDGATPSEVYQKSEVADMQSDSVWANCGCPSGCVDRLMDNLGAAKNVVHEVDHKPNPTHPPFAHTTPREKVAD